MIAIAYKPLKARSMRFESTIDTKIRGAEPPKMNKHFNKEGSAPLSTLASHPCCAPHQKFSLASPLSIFIM